MNVASDMNVLDRAFDLGEIKVAPTRTLARPNLCPMCMPAYHDVSFYACRCLLRFVSMVFDSHCRLDGHRSGRRNHNAGTGANT